METNKKRNNKQDLEAKIKLYESREAIFSRISPQVGSVIDLDNFLQVMVNELGKMLEVSRCDFMVYYPNKVLKINYEYRSDESIPSSLNLTIPLTDGFFDEDKEKMLSPIIIDDTSSKSLHELVRKLSTEMRTKSLLIMPIAFREEILGILGLHHCHQPHHWKQEEINFVGSLAQQVAIAFQYTKLFTKMEKEVEITKTLLEIANELNTKLDFGEITSFIIDKSLDLLKSDFGCIGVFDPSAKYLYFESLRSRGDAKIKFLPENPVSLSENPFLNDYMSSRKSFFINAIDGDQVTKYLLHNIFKGEAVLVSPILFGDKIFGTINLIWQNRNVTVATHHLELLEGIANQTAAALANTQLTSEVTRLKKELDGVRASEIIVGTGEKLKKCIEMALHVADSSTTVLLQGESGTGKELLASLIHKNSSRRDRRLIRINCGAIPETSLEIQLFGKDSSIEKLEDIKGSTIFFNEIEALNPNAQIKLLELVENNEITEHEKLISDLEVRIIAATTENLERALAESKFRKDLFYRLNVYRIDLPPLRDRIEDIPLLVNHFLKTYNKKNNKYLAGISEQALKLLRSYNWPGNVRELENSIERAVILAAKKIITVEDLPEHIREADKKLKEKIIDIEIGSTMHDLEKKLILETLNYTGGDKKKTAEILKIGRKTLYRKLEKYNYHP